MFIAYTIIAVLLSAALTMSASLKLRRAEASVRGIHEVVGVPLSWFPYLSGCECAGALGLLLGIAWAPIGIAAAIGVITYMFVAVIAHFRVGDARNIGSPMILLVVAIATLVTRAVSI
jgi:hypothetical protein